MNTQDFNNRIHDAVENYYRYNPDTLMPILMIALASQGKLQSGTSYSDNATVFCEINPMEVAEYDWVRLNPILRNRINDAIANGCETICVEGYIDESLKDIYETFFKYDNYTVEEEYHHRIGILYEHSDNKASDKAHRQYATICLAEALIDAPKDWLSANFLEEANNMLVKSGLQPARPRLLVANVLKTLLQYDGKGKVYNPFAGCAIAAAAINAGANMYADGNYNDKLFGVARLLNYGMGGSNDNYAHRDSTKWSDAGKFDYVLSTYRGYVNGQSAFDFCLSKCFDTLTECGKFAGIIAAKDIFEKQSPEFKEALKRDWVEKIALLPFGEVAVLINANKDKALKSQILFFDFTHPMLRRRPVHIILQDNSYAETIRVADAKKKGYLRSLVVPEFGERDGHEIVKLGDYVRKLKRQTFSLANVKEDKRVLAYIDRSKPYNRFEGLWMNGIEKTTISSLFAPAYHLTKDSLIINHRGYPEPRVFDADEGSAYFQDGYAFALRDSYDSGWIIDELNEPYVLRQLHPYGMDEMVPEAITEEQILNLKLYKEVEEDIDFGEVDGDESMNMGDINTDVLPTGYVLQSDNTDYTIHKFLGHGFFGYAYCALSQNRSTGEEKEVVLKEFYPYRYYTRDGVQAVLMDEDDYDFVQEQKDKFIEEARIMQKLGNTDDSHIVPAFEFFESEETNTAYYVMPFYNDGSLKDSQDTGFNFSEEMAINHIVKPLCKALHIAHKAKVLHLDIKPENILLDENGDAILADFGVAKQYDNENNIINTKGLQARRSMFAAPELRDGNMVKFGSQTDIYGLAASIYYLLAAPAEPHPVMDFSDQDEDLRWFLKEANCSEEFINAIVAGLQFSATSRPKNAQAFLNMFPGCEDIIL